MTTREQLANNSLTTLDGAHTSAVTTLTVVDGSVFPADGDFRIIAGDEIMLVTARSTNDLTVVRASEGSTATDHAGGTAVRMILTADGLIQFMDEANRGQSGTYPRRFMDEAGVALTSADFSWVNQSTASVTDETWGGMTMKTPSVSAFNHRILVMTAPAAPWTLTAHVLFGPGYKSFGTDGSMMGILAHENSTGKFLSNSLRIGKGCGAFKFNSPTSYSATLGTSFDYYGDEMWLRLEDNNTNIISSISLDGINWLEQGSEARGSFPTGSNFDEVGIFVDSHTADAEALYHFNSFVLE